MRGKDTRRQGTTSKQVRVKRQVGNNNRLDKRRNMQKSTIPAQQRGDQLLDWGDRWMRIKIWPSPTRGKQKKETNRKIIRDKSKTNVNQLRMDTDSQNRQNLKMEEQNKEGGKGRQKKDKGTGTRDKRTEKKGRQRKTKVAKGRQRTPTLGDTWKWKDTNEDKRRTQPPTPKADTKVALRTPTSQVQPCLPADCPFHSSWRAKT